MGEKFRSYWYFQNFDLEHNLKQLNHIYIARKILNER